LRTVATRHSAAEKHRHWWLLLQGSRPPRPSCRSLPWRLTCSSEGRSEPAKRKEQPPPSPTQAPWRYYLAAPADLSEPVSTHERTAKKDRK
jgi:hypothetical protein